MLGLRYPHIYMYTYILLWHRDRPVFPVLYLNPSIFSYLFIFVLFKGRVTGRGKDRECWRGEVGKEFFFYWQVVASTVAAPGWNQEPDSMCISHTGGRESNIWVILCCFPRHFSQVLEQKWISKASAWHFDIGCRWQLNLLCQNASPSWI